MTNDLVQFLRDRLDEDEQAARFADPGPWVSRQMGRHDQAAVKTESGLVQLDGSRAAANGSHIARHDPARVLREVEAKRQIVDLHERLEDSPFCMTCDAPSGIPGQPQGCDTLRLLALSYADHLDYRPEWAPDQA